MTNEQNEVFENEQVSTDVEQSEVSEDSLDMYAEELADQTELANPAGFCTGGSFATGSSFSSVGSSASSVGTGSSVSSAC